MGAHFVELMDGVVAVFVWCNDVIGDDNDVRCGIAGMGRDDTPSSLRCCAGDLDDRSRLSDWPACITLRTVRSTFSYACCAGVSFTRLVTWRLSNSRSFAPSSLTDASATRTDGSR